MELMQSLGEWISFIFFVMGAVIYNILVWTKEISLEGMMIGILLLAIYYKVDK